MTKWLSIAATAALLAGCNQGTAGIKQQAEARPPTFPKPDLSTPDRAVRSYWAVNDTADAFGARNWDHFAAAPGVKEGRDALAAITFGPVNANVLSPEKPSVETYSREIIDVKQETESRAVVSARVKNATPIPAGAVASEYDAKARAEGEVFRYVVEKDATGWKVSQVFTRRYGSNEWKPYFGDRTPTVSTWVRP